jgi:hypothetical protein
MIIEVLEPKQIGVAQSEHTTLVSDFTASTISAPSAAISRSMPAHMFFERVGLDGERPVAAAIAEASGRRFVPLQRTLNRGQGGTGCFHMLPRAGP